MPNWCFNSAEFDNSDPQKVLNLKEAFEQGKAFESIVPNPDGEWDHGFSVLNWGTKWDVQAENASIDDDGSLSVTFDTAWAPPIAFYKALVEQGWKVSATYHEPGMCFIGQFNDGEDECYEYDFSNEDWREDLPEDLVDMLEVEYEIYKEFLEEENAE